MWALFRHGISSGNQDISDFRWLKKKKEKNFELGTLFFRNRELESSILTIVNVLSLTLDLKQAVPLDNVKFRIPLVDNQLALNYSSLTNRL